LPEYRGDPTSSSASIANVSEVPWSASAASPTTNCSGVLAPVGHGHRRPALHLLVLAHRGDGIDVPSGVPAQHDRVGVLTIADPRYEHASPCLLVAGAATRLSPLVIAPDLPVSERPARVVSAGQPQSASWRALAATCCIHMVHALKEGLVYGYVWPDVVSCSDIGRLGVSPLSKGTTS
jgi:hypothetical protein